MDNLNVTPLETITEIRARIKDDPDELLTVEEAAKRYKVPVSFFYAPCRRKGPDAIPCIRVGKYLRYRTSVTDRHFEQKSRGAI